MLPTPHLLALGSAFCAAVAALLIHRGLRDASFLAGAWINVAVGSVAAWTAAALLVPAGEYARRAVPCVGGSDISL